MSGCFRFLIVAVARDSAFAVGKCFVEFPAADMDNGIIEIDVTDLGLQSRRLIQIRKRLVETIEIKESIALVHVRVGQLGIQEQRFGEVGNGRRIAAFGIVNLTAVTIRERALRVQRNCGVELGERLVHLPAR